jgi:two-component system phosphate regulon sensor histidine kinase PhoR
MEAGQGAIASFEFGRCRVLTRRRPGCIGSGVSRAADQAASNFSATLLAMAGHDLRQPLQVITSAHDVLAQTLDSEEQYEELARAADATAELATMLGQLVEALQLRERSDDELNIPVPLRPILEGLAAEFAEAARLKGITFLVTATRWTAFTHPVLLTGMLRNLIRNAIDYTPPGGGVFVTSRRCGPELRIEVRDTGVGIRANALSVIFRAFQRGDESRPDGLGLGLFIVKHAADLLGHRVHVRSAEGRGSCFTIAASAVARGSHSNSVKVRPD